MLSSHPVLTAAAALAVANHLYLKRYEPCRTTLPQTAAFLLLQPTLLLILFRQHASLEVSFSGILSTTLFFFASLATSIVLYRLSPFHPLAKVPGPLLFRISKIWNLYLAWRGDYHVMLKALHDQYGPIVRTGPNDVSVIDSESVKSVLGSEGLGKGPGYLNFKILHQPYPLIAMPTGEARTDRRRVWSRGFTTESIKEYQHIIVEKATQLADGLNARINSEVDLGQWLGFFAFDFMAEMMFGGGSGTLKDGKDTDGALEVLRKGVGISQIITQVPWFSHFFRFIPAISRNEIRLREFSVNWCTRRIQNGAEKKDLWYHLTDEAGHEKLKPTSAVVASDSTLAIVAGSDTTSTAMTNLFWCLMAHPTMYKRLQEEVDREYPAGIDPLVDTSRFVNMKYLNACLNESLRLFPPVPTNGPRVVTEGSGGRIISGHFIPEGTQVLVPPYVVHRSPENFSPRPDNFVPDRWLPDTRDARGRIQKADSFIPFSYGPTNCVGKNLARLEMLMVVTMLVQKFEFEFAKGFDWKEWPNQQTDVLIVLSEPLKVNVKARP